MTIKLANLNALQAEKNSDRIRDDIKRKSAAFEFMRKQLQSRLDSIYREEEDSKFFSSVPDVTASLMFNAARRKEIKFILDLLEESSHV